MHRQDHDLHGVYVNSTEYPIRLFVVYPRRRKHLSGSDDYYTHNIIKLPTTSSIIHLVCLSTFYHPLTHAHDQPN